MSLGDYPDRLRIERREISGRAPNGEDVYAWVLVATLWGKFSPLRGRELIAAKQQQAELIASFALYYRADIVPEMRVVFRGLPYDIESVIDIGGRREELELLTKQGLTNG